MSVRITDRDSEGNPSGQPSPEICDRGGSGLLSARSAAILGASFLIAVLAGVLAFFMIGRFPANLAGAVFAAGTAFAGAVRLLMAIIA